MGALRKVRVTPAGGVICLAAGLCGASLCGAGLWGASLRGAGLVVCAARAGRVFDLVIAGLV